MTFKDEEVEAELKDTLSRIKENVEGVVEEAIDKVEAVVEAVVDKVEDVLDVADVAEIVATKGQEAMDEFEEVGGFDDFVEDVVEELVEEVVEAGKNYFAGKFDELRQKVETGVHIQDKAVKAILLEILELLDA